MSKAIQKNENLEPFLVGAASLLLYKYGNAVEVHMKLVKYSLGRTADWGFSVEQAEELVGYRNILEEMLGKEKDLTNEDFLYEEEVKATKRFVGRWGNNK